MAIDGILWDSMGFQNHVDPEIGEKYSVFWP
jgi:hypothetical protein